MCRNSYCHVLQSFRLTDQFEEASVHVWELLEGRDKAVAGTTCELNTSEILWFSVFFEIELQ